MQEQRIVTDTSGLQRTLCWPCPFDRIAFDRVREPALRDDTTWPERVTRPNVKAMNPSTAFTAAGVPTSKLRGGRSGIVFVTYALPLLAVNYELVACKLSVKHLLRPVSNCASSSVLLTSTAQASNSSPESRHPNWASKRMHAFQHALQVHLLPTQSTTQIPKLTSLPVLPRAGHDPLRLHSSL